MSTSSPVEASYDFTAYNEVVGASLATELVGGSAACAAAVRESFTALDAALAAGGAPAKAASAALNSCQDLSAASPLDVMWGASNAAGVFQGLVQYNDEGGSLDIRAVCQIMANASATPIERLATAVRAASGPSCIDNNYSDYVVTAGNTTADKAARGLGLRQWMWQSCSQFAYWQTCEDRAVCPLSLYMTLESNTRQCADLFGAAFTAAVSEERVKNTNALYGGDRIASTRTIFVNGRIDPCAVPRAFPRAPPRRARNATSRTPNTPTQRAPRIPKGTRSPCSTRARRRSPSSSTAPRTAARCSRRARLTRPRSRPRARRSPRSLSCGCKDFWE